jgi:hypothetical protein
MPDADNMESKHGMNRAIGGYHDITSNGPQIGWTTDGLFCNSARNAFQLLLEATEPRRVWLPRFVCDAVYTSVERAGIHCESYSIDECLLPWGDLTVGEHELILYPNYFGVCGPQERTVVDRFGKERVVLDRSQALHQSGVRARAEIYSLRKFFGVADGGLLRCDDQVDVPLNSNPMPAEHGQYLLTRVTRGAEAGYQQYLDSEAAIEAALPGPMSELTSRILGQVDARWACRRREENFAHLHGVLGGDNALAVDPANIPGPLCYPYLPRSRTICRESLIERGIYVPSYWPEVEARGDLNGFEAYLVRFMLALPCDQRYGRDDMNRILEIIREHEK